MDFCYFLLKNFIKVQHKVATQSSNNLKPKEDNTKKIVEYLKINITMLLPKMVVDGYSLMIVFYILYSVYIL